MICKLLFLWAKTSPPYKYKRSWLIEVSSHNRSNIQFTFYLHTQSNYRRTILKWFLLGWSFLFFLARLDQTGLTGVHKRFPWVDFRWPRDQAFFRWAGGTLRPYKINYPCWKAVMMLIFLCWFKLPLWRKVGLLWKKPDQHGNAQGHVVCRRWTSSITSVNVAVLTEKDICAWNSKLPFPHYVDLWVQNVYWSLPSKNSSLRGVVNNVKIKTWNEKWWPSDWSFRDPVRRPWALWSWERCRRGTGTAGAGPARAPPLLAAMTALDCRSPAVATLSAGPAVISVSAWPITFYGANTFLGSLDEFEKLVDCFVANNFYRKIPKAYSPPIFL